ncbi:hypothetical protein [Desulfatirhabdium butyrativorans]|uniref:hypothetical protein n=1 Tax=Desulfatirhabdium butyrativorans TaxID=340467 RepID=UPI00042381D0|nr:hypothetical protein [Desulfatirhabdium butyrativorans]
MKLSASGGHSGESRNPVVWWRVFDRFWPPAFAGVTGPENFDYDYDNDYPSIAGGGFFTIELIRLSPESPMHPGLHPGQ